MSNAIVLKKINESRRDALVNYAIAENKFGNEIKTADQLYQHLLLDTKISGEVKTTPVGEAISSLQLYIERCVDGAEADAMSDNAKKHFSTDSFLHNWSLYNKRYSRWAGKEKLKYYAADYIDPTLRYNKTELFTEFEQSINQAKLTENAVTKAIQKYLINYEKLARLDTISHLAVPENNTHFFIGRTQESPYQYFWRSCKEDSSSSNKKFTWSEWHKINCNISEKNKTHINLYWNRNRLYLSWVSTEIGKADKDKSKTTHHINVCYKSDDNHWVNEVKYKEEDSLTNFNINDLDALNGKYKQGYGTDYNIGEIKNPTGLSAKGFLKLLNNDIKIRVDLKNTFNLSSKIHEHLKVTHINIYFPDGSISKIDNKHQQTYLIDKKEQPTHVSFSWEITSGRSNNDGSNIIITDNPVKLTAPDPLPLVSNLQVGIDKFLDYNEQVNVVTLNSFEQSYGIYLWELFFHIPLLASARFHTEQRFDEAERWLKFLFNSAGYRNANGELQKDGDNTRYWNMLPLQQDTDWDNRTAITSTDPDIIALQDPMQYKLAVFMRTLDVLITRGDQAYRQLERDTLVDAKMYYVQASQLLGSRPKIQVAQQWENKSLEESAGAISGNQTDGNFLPPYNEVLLAYWDKLDIRLYNLRHNLSLDGQPLHLPLFATPIDPQELQRQHGTGDSISTSMTPLAAATSLYRFPLLLERAKGAVSSVMQFGNALQNALEKQDNEALTLLLQKQQQWVLKQTLDIQNTNINILLSSHKATEVMQGSAEARLGHYKTLLADGVSPHESDAINLRISATTFTSASIIALTIAGIADTAPNIFGLADGGMRWGAIPHASAYGLQTLATTLEQTAGVLDSKANYTRRAQEWQLQQTLAKKDIAQLKEQITGLDLQIAMAKKQYALTELEQSHAATIYQMQSTRFSGKELYNWMVGRLSGLYYQLFDAAQPLCMMAKSALERDIDASKTQHLFTRSGWNDLYQGLLAGEDLMLNLQKLENIWLIEDERALEVDCTVSLAQIYQQSAGFNLAKKVAEFVTASAAENQTADSGNAISIKDDILSAAIKISDLALDKDYPAAMQLGNKRHIKQISVSLPALLGPYQDVQAVLSYSGDQTGFAKGCDAIAISRGMNDSGQFQLDFNDGKYLPFEGIDIMDKGSFELRFPNAQKKQKELLQSLSDIILHIRYTIRS